MESQVPARRMLVVVNSWHDDNKGDAAILQGTLQLAQDLGFRNVAVIPCLDASGPYWKSALRHTQKDFPHIKVLPPVLPAFPAHKRLWLKAFPRAFFKLLWPRLIPSTPDEQALEKCGDVILAGGLYLAFPHTGLWRIPLRLFAYLYPAFYGMRLHKRVIFLGHSLGPFSNPWARWLMAYVLRRAHVVVVRESFSAKLVAELLGQSGRIRIAPDIAFYLRPAFSITVEKFLEKKVGEKPFVVLVPRSLRSYGHDDREESLLFSGLTHLAEVLVKKGYVPILAAHTLGPHSQEDDRLVVAKLAEILRVKGLDLPLFQEDLPPRELMWLYQKATLTVTVRFHGAVLSLAAGTPAVVIPYFGSKAQGTFSDIGLGDLVVPLRGDFPVELEARVRKALNLSKRDLEEIARVQMDNLLQLGEELLS